MRRRPSPAAAGVGPRRVLVPPPHGGRRDLADERFEKDFRDVCHYYKNSAFAKFFIHGPHLFMVFRVGKDAGDIKTFKWLLRDEKLSYLDNRSDHEVRFPSQHDFEWTRTHRDLGARGVLARS